MFTMTFPAATLLDAARQAERAITDARPAAMRQVADWLTRQVAADYDTKSRGGTGSDGITWVPDTRETIELRVRATAAGRQIVAQRRQLALQINTTRGRGAAARVAQLRAARQALSAKLKALVDAAVSSAAIGIDTGMLADSLQSASDASGAEVSFDAPYTPYFSAARHVLPRKIPPAWKDALQQILEHNFQPALEKGFA